MKCYNPHTFTKLGFNEILDFIKGKTYNEETLERWDLLQFYEEPELLLEELMRVLEFKDLLEYGDAAPSLNFYAVGRLLDKARIVGNWLKSEELQRIWGWLISIDRLRSFLQKQAERYPKLNLLVNRSGFQGHLIKDIEKIIDDRGVLRDDASPELKSIRMEQKRSMSELRSVLNKILRVANENGWSNDKEITIRNDRMVIPIRAESKSNLPGFVHDVSQSGATLYIEPVESLTLNNKAKELIIREQNEIVRILQEITAKIGMHADELEEHKETMIRVEMIRAKALLAQALKCNLPHIEADGKRHCISQAYYPPLLLRALKSPFTVVPLDLDFDENQRIFLISGPNAGGKSVSLKTVGLLQVMLQSGFLIPVAENSIFRLFDALFIDIGDEQSIANDLSTYTSHLFYMRQMGDNMDANSLFLIDEFGSGTDPKQGGAIAEAFLERFIRQEAYGVITTHYGNLKKYAELAQGVANAAMEFDTQEIKPTYKIIQGIPGRSYAFEMAQRVGVHPTIIRKARKKMGTDEIRLDLLITELEQKNAQLSLLLGENAKKEGALEKLVSDNERLNNELLYNKKIAARETKLQVNEAIREANRKIENIIREIKESQAEKNLTQKLRKELQEMVSEPEPAPAPVTPANKNPDEGPLKLGDWVRLRDSDTQGKIIDISDKTGIIEAGEIRLRVRLDQVTRIAAPTGPKKTKSQNIRVGTIDAKMEVNVMGMRVEEALPEVDRMLDKALVAGFHRFRILHGKGNGILREAIRTHLRPLPFIVSLRDAHIDEGGDGWTVLELKN